MRVMLLHNAVAPGAPPEERDVLVQAEAVREAMGRLGHSCETVPCTLDLETLRQTLAERSPDVVFNLVESLGGYDHLQHLATSLLDVLRIPYTGAPTDATFLTNHKIRAKQRLLGMGLPTPRWFLAEPEAGEAPPCRPGATYLVKAIAEHASIGLDDAALVECRGPDQLAVRIRTQSERLGVPCFAEEFIAGREFNLSVLASGSGPQVLPPAEIDFSAFPPGKPRIVGYEAKWTEDSFEYVATPRRFDFPPEDGALVEELRSLAAACWRVFGLGGWARVDFRVDKDGHPWILEVNTNPCLSPDAGFAAALARAGIPFEAAVARMLDDALRRPRQ